MWVQEDMKLEDAVSWLAKGSADPSRNFDILRKVLKNIIEHPSEEKYRRLARTNATLRAFVFDGLSAPGAEDALRSVGFVDDSENAQFFILPMSKPAPSADIIRILDNAEQAELSRRKEKDRKMAELEEFEAQKRKEALQKREEEWQVCRSLVTLVTLRAYFWFPVFSLSLSLSLSLSAHQERDRLRTCSRNSNVTFCIAVASAALIGLCMVVFCMRAVCCVCVCCLVAHIAEG